MFFSFSATNSDKLFTFMSPQVPGLQNEAAELNGLHEISFLKYLSATLVLFGNEEVKPRGNWLDRSMEVIQT